MTMRRSATAPPTLPPMTAALLLLLEELEDVAVGEDDVVIWDENVLVGEGEDVDEDVEDVGCKAADFARFRMSRWSAKSLSADAHLLSDRRT